MIITLSVLSSIKSNVHLGGLYSSVIYAIMFDEDKLNKEVSLAEKNSTQ